MSVRFPFFVEVLFNYPGNLHSLFKAFTVDCHSGNSDCVLQYIVRDVWWPHNKSFMKINKREEIQTRKEEGQEERVRKVWFSEIQNSCFGIPTNIFGFIIQIYDCICRNSKAWVLDFWEPNFSNSFFLSFFFSVLDFFSFVNLHEALVMWPPDIPDDILEDAVTISAVAIYGKSFEERVEIARIIKQHLDEEWEPYWHVFLGKSFGCHAVHEKRRFMYFTFEENNISFLIYKAS